MKMYVNSNMQINYPAMKQPGVTIALRKSSLPPLKKME